MRLEDRVYYMSCSCKIMYSIPGTTISKLTNSVNGNNKHTLCVQMSENEGQLLENEYFSKKWKQNPHLRKFQILLLKLKLTLSFLGVWNILLLPILLTIWNIHIPPKAQLTVRVAGHYIYYICDTYRPLHITGFHK